MAPAQTPCTHCSPAQSGNHAKRVRFGLTHFRPIAIATMLISLCGVNIACRDLQQLANLHPSPHRGWQGSSPTSLDEDTDDGNHQTVRLHHLQIKGTHNSYHVEPFLSAIPQWQYTHAPLTEQLEQLNVRQFEFDVHYNSRKGDFDVLHKRRLDPDTTCRLLSQCLGQIRAWSEQHPDHVPLFIMIEPKDRFSAAQAESYFQQLERVVQNAWPLENIITPEAIQRDAPSLAVAITQHGWPSVNATRGKALFTLLDFNKYRNAYTHHHQSLEGRLMFVSAQPNDSYAAVLLLDDPVAQFGEIQRAVQDGFLVRTRADEDTHEARGADPARMRAALASGAHMISTDFPAPVSDIQYWFDLPGGTATHCNPLTAPASCKPTVLSQQPLVPTDLSSTLAAASSLSMDSITRLPGYVDFAARRIMR